MAQEHVGIYCQNCRKMTMHVRDVSRCNHLVHALVTLFLCGLWAPVWIVASMNEKTGPWMCSQCGFAFTALSGPGALSGLGENPFAPGVIDAEAVSE